MGGKKEKKKRKGDLLEEMTRNVRVVTIKMRLSFWFIGGMNAGVI